MKPWKYIPDAITSANLLCGTAGVVFAVGGKVEIAFILMLAAACFDFLDGFAARLLGAWSEFGRELDSLSDVVSFGVLPSVMLVNLMRACSFSESPVTLIPLILAVFSGLRLARFNTADASHDSFTGLATPVSAVLCGSLSYYVAANPGSFLGIWAAGPVFVPVLAVVLSALMVSRIPMFTMKFSREDGRSVRAKRLAYGVALAVIAVVVVVVRLDWSLGFLLAALVYILKNCIYALFKV